MTNEDAISLLGKVYDALRNDCNSCYKPWCKCEGNDEQKDLAKEILNAIDSLGRKCQ